VAGIPTGVLKAYRGAETELGTVAPGCRLTWPLLAAIGKVESDHARDGAIDATGTTLAPILGPLLDGTAGTAAIPDTDSGKLDRDPVWDRAVGPSQFIPATWRVYGIDGGDDGSADPNNVDDAATATGRYLCAGDTNLADPTQLHDAVFRYNHSESYVATVLDWARTYGGDAVLDVPPDATASGARGPGDPATASGPVLLAGPDDPQAAPPVALPPAAFVPGAPTPVALPPAAAAPAGPAPVALPPVAPASVAPAPVAPAPAAPSPLAPAPVAPPASRPATTTPPRPAATPTRVPTATVAPRPAATTPPRAAATTTPPSTTPPTSTPARTRTTPPPSTTTPVRVAQDRPCAGLDATTVATALGVDSSSARTTTSSAGTTVACTVSTRAGVILRAVLVDGDRGAPGTTSVGGVAAAPGGGWQVSGDLGGRHVTLGVPSAAGVTAQNARAALPALARRCG
jgi:hypothetical protein